VTARRKVDGEQKRAQRPRAEAGGAQPPLRGNEERGEPEAAERPAEMSGKRQLARRIT
jgi:hypothetical protein